MNIKFQFNKEPFNTKYLDFFYQIATVILREFPDENGQLLYKKLASGKCVSYK